VIWGCDFRQFFKDVNIQLICGNCGRRHTINCNYGQVINLPCNCGTCSFIVENSGIDIRIFQMARFESGSSVSTEMILSTSGIWVTPDGFVNPNLIIFENNDRARDFDNPIWTPRIDHHLKDDLPQYIDQKDLDKLRDDVKREKKFEQDANIDRMEI